MGAVIGKPVYGYDCQGRALPPPPLIHTPTIPTGEAATGPAAATTVEATAVEAPAVEAVARLTEGAEQ